MLIAFFFTEATIRFLKAKLRVMQEEVDRLSQECNKKVRCNKKEEYRITVTNVKPRQTVTGMYRNKKVRCNKM